MLVHLHSLCTAEWRSHNLVRPVGYCNKVYLLPLRQAMNRQTIIMMIMIVRAVSISYRYIGISANFLPYRYRLILLENFYRYRYKRKERKKKEELEKSWIVNTKDSFTFKVYCNFAFDLQLVKWTNVFSTFLQFLWLNDSDHTIMINVSLMHIIEFLSFSLHRYRPICFFPYRNSSNDSNN